MQSALQDVCNFGQMQKGEQNASARAGTRRTRDARGVSKMKSRVSRKSPDTLQFFLNTSCKFSSFQVFVLCSSCESKCAFLFLTFRHYGK